jgi:site-specific DNA recombinase
MAGTNSAVIYCRVSSVDQEKNCSLATQEASCRRYATAKGWTVVAVESEQHSGAALVDREGLQRALSMIEVGEADVLLAHASDRLSREQLHIGVILDRVLRASASLQFATEDFENSPVGKFLLSARTFAAELELAKIGERTQRGRRARVAAGKPLAGPKAPFGYHWLDPERKRGNKTRLVADPDTAPIVRLVFDLALAGLPLRRISDELAANGIPAPSGAARWQPSSIREILLRPAYSGSLVTYAIKHERQPGGGYVRRRATEEERVVLPSVAEPIVSPEEQFAVIARLEQNKAHSTRRNLHPEAALLRAGYIVCGHCGWALSVSNATPASRSLSPQYRCTAQRQHGPACPRPSISASIIDGVVWQKVCDVLRDPAIIAAEVAKQRDGGGLERHLTALEATLERIVKKQRNLATLAGSVDDPEAAAPLVAELKVLSASKQAGERERDELERRIANQAAESAKMQSLADWCGRVNANLDTLTYEERRMALTWLGVEVRTYRLGTSDASGTPYPRWELTMRPNPDMATVYDSTH